MPRKPAMPDTAIPEAGEGKRGVDGYLAYLLRQAAGAARLATERVLADLGVTPPQFMVLTMLEAYPGVSGADIARLAQLTPQTVNLIIRNLERAGAVERAAHPVHGRVLQLSLSESGRALLAACKQQAGGVNAALAEGLAPAEESVVRAWLVRVAVRLGSG